MRQGILKEKEVSQIIELSAMDNPDRAWNTADLQLLPVYADCLTICVNHKTSGQGYQFKGIRPVHCYSGQSPLSTLCIVDNSFDQFQAG